MSIGFMRIIWYFYIWTWFIWPFVFVFSFSYGLSRMIVNKDNSGKVLLLISSISLLIILAGIVAPGFY
ncbi:MAG: hypothetical protein GX829_12565 [Clostridium sp.]|nr:hypothetical protein [Clostridium sp.]